MPIEMQAPLADTFVFPADVWEFAARQGIQDKLEPLRQATLRLFPTGALSIRFAPDAEMRELDAILFEMTVKVSDVPDRNGAELLWFRELNALMPKPSTIIEPILSLQRVKG